MMIDGVEYVIGEEEKESFLEILKKHKELCITIHQKKKIAKVIELKLNEIYKSYNKISKEIISLIAASTKLETQISLIAKPSIILKHSIYYILKKLDGMEEKEKESWLLRHKEESEIFLNFNFDNLINNKQDEFKPEEKEEEEIEIEI